jgi:Collagen triple helix repeat (20 copies)
MTTFCWPPQVVITGPVGPAGPPGPAGADGAAGATGASGPPGDTGDQGDSGVDGSPGPAGVPGSTGPAGADGAAGAAGPSGPPGDSGEQGDEGEQGATGPVGLTGPMGPPGEISYVDVADSVAAIASPVVAGPASGGPFALLAFSIDTSYLVGDFMTPGGQYVSTGTESIGAFCAPFPMVMFDPIWICSDGTTSIATSTYSVRKNSVDVFTATLAIGQSFVQSAQSLLLDRGDRLTIQLDTGLDPGSPVMCLFRWRAL